MRATEATRRLGIAYPIVLGPFGGGLSTVALASTVSNLGGLGSFGAHVLAPEAIDPLVRDLRAATDKPFAVNLWVSNHDPGAFDLARAKRLFAPWLEELGLPWPEVPAEVAPSFTEQVDALIEARPPVFSFVFGIPEKKIRDACKQRGILTAGAATTIAEARALDEAGVDLIVASGFEAGGHRPSFLARSEDSLHGTLALVPLVVDRVKAPVIAAGGIADRRGIDAVLALGAGAAQIGTAFLACDESGTTDEHRSLLRDADDNTTVLTRAFSGRFARGLSNRWTREVHEHLPYPLQGFFTAQLRRAAILAKRTDVLSLWASQITPNVRHRSAKELFASLTKEA